MLSSNSYQKMFVVVFLALSLRVMEVYKTTRVVIPTLCCLFEHVLLKRHVLSPRTPGFTKM